MNSARVHEDLVPQNLASMLEAHSQPCDGAGAGVCCRFGEIHESSKRKNTSYVYSNNRDELVAVVAAIVFFSFPVSCHYHS